MQKLGWLLFMSLSVAAAGQDMCKTCTLDFMAPVGFYSSSLCIKANQCPAGGPPKAAFLESENPGILLAQHAGKLQVRTVLHNSPAEHAGIRVGDEILSINGRRVGASSCSGGWTDTDHTSSIVLHRGAGVIKVRVAAAPFLSLVASESLVFSSNGGRSSFGLDAPFTLGLRWTEHPGYLEISQLLAGSPADGAGLRVGDRVVSLNGVAFGTKYAPDVSELEDSDLPTQVIIETAGDRGRRQLVLYSRGISEIIASPDKARSVPRTERSSLNPVFVPARAE